MAKGDQLSGGDQSVTPIVTRPDQYQDRLIWFEAFMSKVCRRQASALHQWQALGKSDPLKRSELGHRHGRLRMGVVDHGVWVSMV
jgi:hypothetical protein